MTEHGSYASGNWFVTQGREQEFVARWGEFAQWTRDVAPGLDHAHLMRDDRNPGHFLSVSRWQDAASRSAWTEHPEFQEQVGACIKLCDDTHMSTYEQVTAV